MHETFALVREGFACSQETSALVRETFARVHGTSALVCETFENADVAYRGLEGRLPFSKVL